MRDPVLAAFMAAVVTAGCATPKVDTKQPQPEDPTQSTALEMAHAAGMTAIDDVDPDNIDRDNVHETRSSVLAASVFAGADALDPPLGLPPAAAGVLGFASWMNTGSTNPAADSRVIGWVPVDEVDSPKEAHKRFHRELRTAMHNTVDHFELSEPYRFGEHVHEPYLGTRSWPIRGAACSSDAFVCQYGYDYFSLEYVEMIKAYAPEVVGGFRAYVPNEPRDWPLFYVSKRQGAIRHAGFPDLRFYRGLSRRLPAWMAIYIAPKQASYEARPEADYDWKFNKVPMILHQGEVEYFIAPKNATSGDADNGA